MKRAIRAGVIVVAALAFTGIPGHALADETPAAGDTAAKVADVPCKVSDPCVDVNPGAASPEPPQEVESEVHDKAQGEWITSIWTTP